MDDPFQLSDVFVLSKFSIILHDHIIFQLLADGINVSWMVSIILPMRESVVVTYVTQSSFLQLKFSEVVYILCFS